MGIEWLNEGMKVGNGGVVVGGWFVGRGFGVIVIDGKCKDKELWGGS